MGTLRRVLSLRDRSGFGRRPPSSLSSCPVACPCPHICQCHGVAWSSPRHLFQEVEFTTVRVAAGACRAAALDRAPSSAPSRPAPRPAPLRQATEPNPRLAGAPIAVTSPLPACAASFLPTAACGPQQALAEGDSIRGPHPPGARPIVRPLPTVGPSVVCEGAMVNGMVHHPIIMVTCIQSPLDLAIQSLPPEPT